MTKGVFLLYLAAGNAAGIVPLSWQNRHKEPAAKIYRKKSRLILTGYSNPGNVGTNQNVHITPSFIAAISLNKQILSRGSGETSCLRSSPKSIQ